MRSQTEIVPYLGVVSIAGLALAAVVLLIGAYLTPLWINRRHAMVLSREGDRFSAGVRVVEATQGGNPAVMPSRVLTVEGPKTQPLLASRPEEKKAVMGNSQAPRRPQRASQSAQRKLNAVQMRELAALKAKRAARLSAEAATARRRLVTTLIALAVFIVVVGVGAAGLISWWWLLIPGFFLGGSLVTSRLAGIDSERKNQEERARFAALRAAVPEEPVASPKEARKIRDMLAESVEASGTTEAPATAKAEPVATVSETPQTQSETGEEHEATENSWEVKPLPVPSHQRKSIIKGREVHTDTDIAGVPRVAEAPGRPIAATKVGGESGAQTATNKATFNFDLDAVLDARRA